MRWPEEPWPCSDDANEVMNRRTNTIATGYIQKMPADHPEYKAKVAEPTMQAIDGLPEEYRRLIHDYDYVDIYRAYLHKWPVELVKRAAAMNGGRFVYQTNGAIRRSR